MKFFARRLLAGALLSSTLIMSGFTATAQDVTMVLPSREMGAPTYDPIRGTKLNMATTLIYDRIVILDEDQTYHGQLADSWEVSDDGMSWTFKLRPGVVLHDGEPFNAATVAWRLPKFVGTENALMTEAIASIEVVDDLTVHLTMKNPDPSLLSNMATSFMAYPRPRPMTRWVRITA